MNGDMSTQSRQSFIKRLIFTNSGYRLRTEFCTQNTSSWNNIRSDNTSRYGLAKVDGISEFVNSLDDKLANVSVHLSEFLL